MILSSCYSTLRKLRKCFLAVDLIEYSIIGAELIEQAEIRCFPAAQTGLKTLSQFELI